MRVFVALALVACGAHGISEGPTTVRAIHADALLPIVSTDVTFSAGGRDVPGTLVRPQRAGRWPAVVLLAGSGPTDRDWGSPLLATNNGSGKLLADELASRGAVVLRFDKAGAGKNPGPPIDQVTLDTFRDEALAAIAFVRTRADVRADRVFVAGHSEGGVHATRVALAAKPPVAGVIYLSSPGRPMADAMLTQLEGNLRNPMARLDDAFITAELTALRAAFADFLAGRPVDPLAASKIPQLQRLVAGLTNPPTASLMRALLGYDHAREAPKLAIPVLVTNGGKDVQIDPELDAKLLATSFRRANRDVTLVIAPNADHVLKHEEKSLAELRADLVYVQNHYNAFGRTLDKELVGAVIAWLAAHTR
jgi:pimeloyl-ACP methyl ester carboxylesterase